MRTIAFVLFDDVEELDFVGPWEVLAFAAKTIPDSCRVFTVAERAGTVRCAKGLRVVADYGFDDCPAADVLLVPGGMGTRREVDNPRLIGFIKRLAAEGEIATSVCTGSFLLERAGLLAGRKAVTHWASMERLRQLGSVEVVEQRFVDTGEVITAAGVSAGIDMALHLVGRLWGAEAARQVQHGIEYYPEPPYAGAALPAQTAAP